MHKRRIVFSGINMCEGGPLTILREFASFASQSLIPEFEVYFLVKNRSFLPDGKFKVIEFPNSKKTILHKLYYEYFFFKSLSRKIKPSVWVSLNDCTPTVVSPVRCVYFHNATPFYKISWMDFCFPSWILAQKLYYPILYRINLKRNKFIVVQQSFLKNYINEKFSFPKERILISRPDSMNLAQTTGESPGRHDERKVIFFYPTKPEVYKNIHVICKAVAEIRKREIGMAFEVRITISGNENRYSRYIKKFSELYEEIVLVGRLGKNELVEHYQQSHCLLFPSKLETWGLPLTEACQFEKYIVSADLPYAHETLAGYEKATFFDPSSTHDLAQCMIDFVSNSNNRPRHAVKKNLGTIVSQQNHSLDGLFKKFTQSVQ